MVGLRKGPYQLFFFSVLVPNPWIPKTLTLALAEKEAEQ